MRGDRQLNHIKKPQHTKLLLEALLIEIQEIPV